MIKIIGHITFAEYEAIMQTVIAIEEGWYLEDLEDIVIDMGIPS